jgi:flagellar basal body-associated protein FliL
VTLEVGDPSIIKIFGERNYRIREIVIDAITDKTLDELGTSGQRADLRQEILDRINEEFNTTAVRRVVFGEFYFH